MEEGRNDSAGSADKLTGWEVFLPSRFEYEKPPDLFSEGFLFYRGPMPIPWNNHGITSRICRVPSTALLLSCLIEFSTSGDSSS